MLQSADLSPRLTRRNLLKSAATASATVCAASLYGVCAASGQEPADSSGDTATTTEATDQSRLKYTATKTERWQFGLRLTTPTQLANVLTTFVIPMDWPEQTVVPVSQKLDPRIAGWKIRPLLSGARQMVLTMKSAPSGSTTEALFEFDVKKSHIELGESTDDLVIPSKIPRDLRVFTGNSPNIDTSNGRIKKVARELAAEEVDNDWKRVEQIYDFVRDKVQYVEGPIRKASDALKSGRGDCEDMTSLFVALCRNFKIPARMVWIPDHCYPEFYLEDAQGNGTWFPCQAAGTRQFGRMQEYRPILQKGDRFKVPEKRKPVRYVSEFFKCDRRGNKTPKPRFIRQRVDV